MGRKIIACFLVGILLLAPAAWAAPEETTPTGTAQTEAQGFIPETIDLGRFNSFNPLNYWPWRSLTVEIKGGAPEAVYLDILSEDPSVGGSWQGLDTARLEVEGLTREDVAPLISIAPEGWGGLLTHAHDGGRIDGSMIAGEKGWFFQRSLPENIRLAYYMPQSGVGACTATLRLRQHQSRVELNLTTGQARVLHNTKSGLWRLKLLLRIVISAGLVLMACLPIFDRRRWTIFGVKLASGMIYMLLVLLAPGLFEGAYALALILVQLVLTLLESGVLYMTVTNRQVKPTAVYASISLAASWILGLWWLA